MKLHLYAIYDTAAAYYKNPWCAHTDEQAMREFTDIFSGDNPIAAHPEHYYLIHLGDFDNQTAELKQNDVKTLLTGLETLANAADQTNEPLALFPQDQYSHLTNDQRDAIGIETLPEDN